MHIHPLAAFLSPFPLFPVRLPLYVDVFWSVFFALGVYVVVLLRFVGRLASCTVCRACCSWACGS